MDPNKAATPVVCPKCGKYAGNYTCWYKQWDHEDPNSFFLLFHHDSEYSWHTSTCVQQATLPYYATIIAPNQLQ
jgi:hypothetical protein